MTRAVLILSNDGVKKRAHHWIDNVPPGTRVTFQAPKRTTDQNAKFWACLSDVAAQLRWHGLKLSTEDWKLIFLDALKRETRIVPNIDGTGFVQLGRSSSDLSVGEMADLITLIQAFGASHGVKFHDPLDMDQAA